MSTSPDRHQKTAATPPLSSSPAPVADARTTPHAPPPTPRTRLFWIPFAGPEEGPSNPLPGPDEPVYQQALKDVVQDLIDREALSSDPLAPEPAHNPPSLPTDPVPESPEPPPESVAPTPTQAPMQPRPPRPEHAQQPSSQATVADAETPPTKGKHHSKAKRQSAANAAPPPVPEGHPSTARPRVRRDLFWPEDESLDSSGS